MPIFLNIKGIDGDTTNTQFQNWFEISSFSWGDSNGAQSHATGGGGGAGKVHFEDLTVTKSTGRGSPLLMVACASGKHLPAVQLVVTTSASATSAQEQTFLTITLTNALVTGYHMSDDAAGMPQDEFSLNFADIEYDQTYANADGTLSIQSANWNLSQGGTT